MYYIKYKITSDEQSIMDKIISGVLPHNNFDESIASDVLEKLFALVPEEELYGVYYAIFRIIKNIKTISLYRKNYNTALNREVYTSAIETGVQQLIKDEGFGARMYFNDYGKAYNLEIEGELNDALNFVYTELLNKYDELYEMAIPTGESLAHISVLKESMKTSISEAMTTVQGRILTTGYQFQFRVLRGYDDWLEFTTACCKEISTRFDDVVEDRYTPDTIMTYEDSKKFNSENANKIRILYYMGFEPIDNITPIHSGDIVSFVATEGVGKTRMVVDQIVKAILAGCNILVMCGETKKSKMKGLVEAAYVYWRCQKQFTWSEILDPSTISCDEDQLESLLILINSYIAELYETPSYGKISYVQAFCYENLYDTLKSEYDKFKYDIVMIDHVSALDSTGAMTTEGRLFTRTSKIDYLFKCEDRLTKELDVTFINTNHTSNDAEDRLVKGKDAGVRIGGNSASTTKWASIVFLLTTTPDLERQDCVILTCKKLRDIGKPEYPLLLRRCGFGNIHIYDQDMQYQIKGGSEDIDTDEEGLY